MIIFAVSGKLTSIVMTKLSFVAFLLFLVSCESQPASQADTKTDTSTRTHPELSPAPVPGGTDSSSYDPEFLSQLRASGQAYVFSGGKLIVGGDTLTFPHLDSAILFTGKNAELSLLLAVRRLNATSLAYHYELHKRQKLADSGSGKAILHPNFYLAAEMEEDESTGASYPCVDFIDEHHAASSRTIRLGLEKDEAGRNRAKWSATGTGTFHLSLSDCPVLYGK